MMPLRRFHHLINLGCPLPSPFLAFHCVQAHGEIINSIDGVGGLGVGEGAPEIVTGSRDGVVKVWDPRQSTPVASVEPADGEEKVRTEETRWGGILDGWEGRKENFEGDG